MNQLAVQQDHKPVSILTPTNFEQAMEFADLISRSGMVPKDYINKPGAVLVAMQMGAELGLQPMQAIQNISVINGRPSVWGDCLLAVARGSDKCESIREVYDEERQMATCIVKRKDEEHEIIRTFSMADAQLAGLAGKPGPWKQYPKRMCQMRARSFALRDAFPDALRGISVAEESMDIPPERDVTPANGSAKVADLTARLAAPVQQQPMVRQQVIQQKEPEPVIEQAAPVQQDNGIQQLQQATEARQQAMQDEAPETKVLSADPVERLQQQLIEDPAPVGPVTEKDKFAFEMVMGAIKDAKTKYELQEIISDANALHPDLKDEARKAYSERVKDFHQK